MSSSSPLARARLVTPPAALGALAAAAGLVGLRDGTSHLAGVWASSPTYHHGALVPLVSAYLVWLGWRPGDRAEGWPLALVGVAATLAVYASGLVLDARLLQHLGVAGYAATAAAAVLGRAAATRHRFALAFLLLMVPFGEGLVPFLQNLTAYGVTSLCALFGLAHYRDGLLIHTDAGVFAVEEACAGLRFVIASLVTGVLGAHLFFTRVWKQAVLVAAAVLVPVAANLMRAGGTVVIASLTNKEVAAGVDHLVYGWAFFALVTGAVILVALHHRDEDAPRLAAPAPAGPGRPLACGVAAGLLALPFGAF